jgi:glycerol-3-phosphate cytidylyltransferase
MCRLVVGVSSDKLNISKKDRSPIMSQEDRIYMCAAVRYVDAVFCEEALELKAKYCEEYQADVLVMGNDHLGRFDWVTEETCGRCRTLYLERTPSISTTAIIEKAAAI